MKTIKIYPKMTASFSKIVLIVPTFNGKKEFIRLFESLKIQTRKIELFVVDSSSTDGLVDFLDKHQIDFEVIKQSDFNHGGTRRAIVERFSKYDFCVFMTQDAILADEFAIERLLEAFDDEAVGAVYGRQLPHQDAKPWASHARLFNYPLKSEKKSLANQKQLGIKTVFISNVFSAYRIKALLAIGNFPQRVILSEDMYVGAKLILANWKLVYQAKACCLHSHNYTLKEEFKRYFDIGVFNAQAPWIKSQFGRAEKEGMQFLTEEIRFLGWRRFYYWPRTFLSTGLKYLAYQLGQHYHYLPRSWCLSLSMHHRYWQLSKSDAKRIQ